ncbi:transglutaminase-like domain-containing protein [Anaeromicropila herbilytica]|uniref:Transglutaminase-like domain-containing protein n=1 Tax=Anaeromicropila herbilytica TaxID=2785025 RepID=A0A7R7ELS2_9FIRM|nr:transglutaminase-like domain-containing protein [Anaeromicropila herbilytica]BCN31122.1 hypothetical protein bsdtb5_24170 [Anaeromicropila herbilytica]
MINRKSNMILVGFLFIIGASIIILVGSRLLNINLSRYAYKTIAVIDLLIGLFYIYNLINKNNRKVINPVPETSRIEVLRKYAEYDLNHKEKRYSYTFQIGNEVPEVLEKYRYSEYLKDVDPMSDMLVFRLFDFVCDNFHHDGSVAFNHDRRMVDIILACELNNGKTNCRGLSMVLAALLRMNGIKARHVTCMPYEEPFADCHVVVDCLIPSGKRVMLDPTMRLYLKDTNGEYVSLDHFRKGLIEGEIFLENQDASYNSEKFDKESYIQYMSKNLFRFSSSLIYADVKNERKLGQIELIPQGYSIKYFSNKNKLVYNPTIFWSI